MSKENKKKNFLSRISHKIKELYGLEDEKDEDLEDDITPAPPVYPSKPVVSETVETQASGTWQDKVKQYGVYTGSQQYKQGQEPQNKTLEKSKNEGLSAKWLIIGIVIIFLLVIRSCAG